MSDQPHDFDEALVSGYLDGELTHGEAQRVRVHLEGCPACRDVEKELRQLKEASMTTRFRLPEDTQWDEAPRNGLSRALTLFGWSVAALWATGLAAFLLWQAVTGNESTRFDAPLVLAPMVAAGSIVGSALVDRLQTRTNDPYRKVQK